MEKETESRNYDRARSWKPEIKLNKARIQLGNSARRKPHLMTQVEKGQQHHDNQMIPPNSPLEQPSMWIKDGRIASICIEMYLIFVIRTKKVREI